VVRKKGSRRRGGVDGRRDEVVLVDTSVWVNHLREGNQRLKELLEEGMVLCHPFVIGEIACGTLKNRTGVLTLLQELPEAPAVEHWEVMRFIENDGLWGSGLGYVDVHLLASSMLSNATLWTLDRRLLEAATQIGVSVSL
jgi:predicted nucleic acid-binding protein